VHLGQHNAPEPDGDDPGRPDLDRDTTTVQTTPAGSTVGQSIEAITLYVGDNTVDQNLPLDPSGFLYDSVTRERDCPALRPWSCAAAVAVDSIARKVVGGGVVGLCVQKVFVGGYYEFFFVNGPPDGVYTLRVVSADNYLTTPAVRGGVTAPNLIGGVATRLRHMGPRPRRCPLPSCSRRTSQRAVSRRS
jgi:hypothetical protein